jgi:hypothetical protein
MIVTDEGAGGATLYDTVMPTYGDVVQYPCDPRDKWTSTGYINKSNAFPPACIPGSAQGLRRMKYRWNGTLDFRIAVADVTMQNPVGPLRVTIYDGTEPVNECDGWVGDSAACRVSSKRVRCP